jgi:hypothetical protein
MAGYFVDQTHGSVTRGADHNQNGDDDDEGHFLWSPEGVE